MRPRATPTSTSRSAPAAQARSVSSSSPAASATTVPAPLRRGPQPAKQPDPPNNELTVVNEPDSPSAH